MILAVFFFRVSVLHGVLFGWFSKRIANRPHLGTMGWAEAVIDGIPFLAILVVAPSVGYVFGAWFRDASQLVHPVPVFTSHHFKLFGHVVADAAIAAQELAYVILIEFHFNSFRLSAESCGCLEWADYFTQVYSSNFFDSDHVRNISNLLMGAERAKCS